MSVPIVVVSPNIIYNGLRSYFLSVKSMHRYIYISRIAHNGAYIRIYVTSVSSAGVPSIMITGINDLILSCVIFNEIRYIITSRTVHAMTFIRCPGNGVALPGAKLLNALSNIK